MLHSPQAPLAFRGGRLDIARIYWDDGELENSVACNANDSRKAASLQIMITRGNDRQSRTAAAGPAKCSEIQLHRGLETTLRPKVKDVGDSPAPPTHVRSSSIDETNSSSPACVHKGAPEDICPLRASPGRHWDASVDATNHNCPPSFEEWRVSCRHVRYSLRSGFVAPSSFPLLSCT